MSEFLLLLLRKASERLCALPECHILYERVHTTKLMLFQQPLLSPQCKAHSMFRKKKKTTLLSIASVSQYSAQLHWAGQCIHYINIFVFKRGTNNIIPIKCTKSALISGQLISSNICTSLKWSFQFLKNRTLTRPACIILQATKANIKLGTWL